MFDFSRPNSSNKLMENILRLWTPKIQRAGIERQFSLEADIPLIPGDSVELQLVFSNLIINATEAMHEDGTLTINTSTALSTFHTPEGKNVILITVKDTGKGINSDIKQMIFNPFFSTKNGHAGLGLPISYQIIKRHGGVLSCNNSEAGETQFTIELPIDQTQADGEKK